jgi:hypothetical protein
MPTLPVSWIALKNLASSGFGHAVEVSTWREEAFGGIQRRARPACYGA